MMAARSRAWINRTIVYAVVTALLAAAYAGGVLFIQTILPVPEGSPLVVATTTLAVVALFRPLRARVQRFVDRRFNRHRYDAELTAAEFGSRLRAETNLERLSGDLVDIVRTTMQPASVSLWLRAYERAGSGTR